MAADHKHDHDVPAMDYSEHERTFALFAALIKWGTAFCIVFVLLVGSFAGTISWAFTLIVSALTIGLIAKFF